MPSHTLKQIKVSANLPALKLNRHLIAFFKCFCIFIIHLKNFESTPKRSLSMGLNFLPKTRLQPDNRLSRHQACRKARWKPQIFLFLSAFPRKNKECDSLTIKLTVIIRPCAFIAWIFLKPYLTQISVLVWSRSPRATQDWGVCQLITRLLQRATVWTPRSGPVSLLLYVCQLLPFYCQPSSTALRPASDKMAFEPARVLTEEKCCILVEADAHELRFYHKDPRMHDRV